MESRLSHPSGQSPNHRKIGYGALLEEKPASLPFSGAARGAEAARGGEFAAFYAGATTAEIRKRIRSDPEFRAWAESRVAAEVKHPDDAPAPAPEMFVIRRISDGRYFADEDNQGRPAWRAKVEHASRMGRTRSRVTSRALAAQGFEVEILGA